MNLTFLNAIFLAGLAAAAIPVVIHLLQRRRLKRVEFSDLRFLAPLNQQRMRSLHIRRLLLLLLRVLIVGLTAVAMARPSLRGALSSFVPTRARSSVMLLVDTSYSMRAEGEHGTALDLARAAATDILSQLDEGDAVSLMTFDEAPHRLFRTPVRDLGAVRTRLQELQPSYRRTDWKLAVEAALADLSGAQDPNRELYVLSDFMGAGVESLQAELRQQQGDIRVTLVPVRVEPFVNVSIEGVHIPPGAILRDDPVRVGVTARNHASDAPADCVLRLTLDGEAKGEANLRLGRGAVQTHDFTLVATQTDDIAGIAAKRVDRLPADDVSYFVLQVLSQLHVLHVYGSSRTGGSFFVGRALEPGGGARSPIALTEVEASRLSSRDLEGVQVVVVSADAALTRSQADILADFVADGGGLCVFSAQRETADAVNALFTVLGDTRVRGVVARTEGFLTLADLRPTGILAGFEAAALGTLQRVQFTRTSEVTPGPDARVVLRFTGGAAAVVEGVHGTGKFMLYAFDPATDGSDLALSPMFLPLLHRTVVYLAGETGRQKLVYNVGERIELQIPLAAGGAESSGSAGHDFTVTTPTGERQELEVRPVGKLALVAYEKTDTPGHYIFSGLGRRLVRAVNVDVRESILEPIDPETIAKHLGVEAQTLADVGSVGQHIREARYGKELYKPIVVLVLIAMTAELLLSRVASAAVPASGSAD